MEKNEEFKLSKEEIESPLWLKLEKQMKSNLEQLRKANDYSKVDMERTMFIRGGISNLKDYLSLNPANEDI